MNTKSLKTLEYDKIILQLEEYASSPLGQKLCRQLLPSIDIQEIRISQAETSDALDRVRQKGSLSFSGLRDVTDSLKRLEIGSFLGIAELLAISSILTIATKAKAYGRHEESELPDDSLEEMFQMDIPEGFLYYGENRRRHQVEFTSELRSEVERTADKMHEMFRRGHTPGAKPSKQCKSCSLENLCLPKLQKSGDVRKYIEKNIYGGE